MGGRERCSFSLALARFLSRSSRRNSLLRQAPPSSRLRRRSIFGRARRIPPAQRYLALACRSGRARDINRSVAAGSGAERCSRASTFGTLRPFSFYCTLSFALATTTARRDVHYVHDDERSYPTTMRSLRCFSARAERLSNLYVTTMSRNSHRVTNPNLKIEGPRIASCTHCTPIATRSRSVTSAGCAI